MVLRIYVGCGFAVTLLAQSVENWLEFEDFLSFFLHVWWGVFVSIRGADLEPSHSAELFCIWVKRQYALWCIRASWSFPMLRTLDGYVVQGASCWIQKNFRPWKLLLLGYQHEKLFAFLNRRPRRSLCDLILWSFFMDTLYTWSRFARLTHWWFLHFPNTECTEYILDIRWLRRCWSKLAILIFPCWLG